MLCSRGSMSAYGEWAWFLAEDLNKIFKNRRLPLLADNDGWSVRVYQRNKHGDHVRIRPAWVLDIHEHCPYDVGIYVVYFKEGQTSSKDWVLLNRTNCQDFTSVMVQKSELWLLPPRLPPPPCKKRIPSLFSQSFYRLTTLETRMVIESLKV